MELSSYFQILGVDSQASWAEIKEAYRDQIQVWHPDRFEHNPRLQGKAQRKTREVLAAFTELKRLREQDQLHAHCVDHEPTAQPQHAPDEPWEAVPRPFRPQRRWPTRIADLMRVCASLLLMPLQIAYAVINTLLCRLAPAIVVVVLIFITLQSMGLPAWNRFRSQAAEQRVRLEHILTFGLDGH